MKCRISWRSSLDTKPAVAHDQMQLEADAVRVHFGFDTTYRSLAAGLSLFLRDQTRFAKDIDYRTYTSSCLE